VKSDPSIRRDLQNLAAEIRKKQTEVEVDARASWGAAVLRPYTDVRDGQVEVMDRCFRMRR
jgi:hypothetical protein